MQHKNTGKLISLFALLYLAFFIINPNSLWSAEDDIVWQYKVQLFDKGILLKNESEIFLSGAHSVFRDVVTGQEIARYENTNFKNSTIFLYNNDLNYIQASVNNRKLFIYETNSYKVIDSIDNNEKELGQLFGNQRTGILYESLTDKIRVWDIVQKKVVREMLFPKYEEPNLYSHEISSAIDCNNEKIIVQHNKQYRPESNPNTWYDKKYITFYDAQTLDSLESINITGGRFKLSSTCKYFVRIQGNIELYDFNSMKLLNTYLSPLTDVVFTSDDKYLITIDDVSINQMQVWDINQNLLIKTIKKGSSKILSITKDSKFALCSAGSTFFKLRLNLDPNSVEDENPILEDTKSYPNPTNSSLEIKYNVQRPNVYLYEITNITGHIFSRNNLGFKNLGENIETIDVQILPIGQYNLRIYSENEQINMMFIKSE